MRRYATAQLKKRGEMLRCPEVRKSYKAGQMLVSTNRAMLRRDSGGFETPPTAFVTPRAISSEI